MFKNKCAQINDQVSVALKPVSDACKSTVTDIGKNFETSENVVVKNIR